jgi:hypothetical protein
MSGVEANDTARSFPDLDELAIKKLFGFLHGCFVVLTFNDLGRLPNVATFVEGVNAIRRHDPPRNSKELQRSPSGAGRELISRGTLRASLGNRLTIRW